MDRHRHAVLERQAPVAGEMVGVRVRLERAGQPHAVTLGCLEHRLDREERIDDDRDTGVLVADQVRGTAEIVVQELLEEHGARR